MEKNGATIASINNDMEATQKQNAQPKKEHFFLWLTNLHTLLAITCQMTMQKCFHMGNLKECGVTTKLKLRDAMKRGAAIRISVVLSQISDLFATKVHLYVARYVLAIKCEF